jgi:protein-S-isoprenylcysteine O-methyltransferase Ste14
MKSALLNGIRSLTVPPLLAGALLAAAWLLDRALPALAPRIEAPVVGWVLIALGALLMLWALVFLLSERTAVHPQALPSALVVRGPFRATRNPIYLGDVLALAGIGLLQGTLPFLCLPLVFAIVMDRWFIRREEHRLATLFPEEWPRFRTRVRRWL